MSENKNSGMAAVQNIITGMEKEKELIIQDTITLLEYIDKLKDEIKKSKKLWFFKDPKLNFTYFVNAGKCGILRTEK